MFVHYGNEDRRLNGAVDVESPLVNRVCRVLEPNWAPPKTFSVRIMILSRAA